MPMGAHVMSKQWQRYGAGTPAVLSHANGPWVWDTEHRRYYDYCAGLAAVTLGHNHPVVTAALYGAVGQGVLHLPRHREIEVSEAFCEAVGAEQVRWVSTGSEAAEGAVRIARIATGRDLVFSIGYHSWYATFSAAKPIHPGCPERFRYVLYDFPYNDLDAIRYNFEMHKDVAAVIVEPTAIEKPNDGYLDGLRALCTEHGALLIFDEVICGFRFHTRGGAGAFEVEPDLQIYGKTITNGAVPAACIVGPEQYMRYAWPVSGTANAHPLALAAVGAVLNVYRQTDIPAALWREGAMLWAHLRSVQETGAHPYILDGWPIRPRITFPNDPEQIALSAFVQRLAERGVLWQPSGANVMATAEGREDANGTVITTTFEVADAWAQDPAGVRDSLAGGPLSPTGLRA